jgi:hypothetical protein
MNIRVHDGKPANMAERSFIAKQHQVCPFEQRTQSPAVSRPFERPD